ncbi:unnamed protein product [Hyaloperonospora brassicae]|uniref:Peptidase M14 domain-containing protein n=1 Tax=Hyaloperonospora brassicae TaxID=162125 RepID=A0AAV0TTK5_HYABA|nr:unnamed protein product [Hyaloperonospora brassicae]
MLRSCLALALGVCFVDDCYARVDPAPTLIKCRTYAETAAYLLELNATFPDVVRVSVAQETYNLPYPKELRCIVDEKTNATEPCKHFVVHLTNHATLASDPERPEVFFSGAVHGNERVGPNAVVELVALFAHATSKYRTKDMREPTADTQRWLKELVNTRNVVLVPMTNAYGYSRNERRELTLDPNRDYNYMRAGAECMQTMTSRVVNEIWRDHIFQLAVTFHGGTQAIAYEWGAPNHYFHGDKTQPSQKSPDDVAQVQLGITLANFAGTFANGELLPAGTMNEVVYGVTGGMEDWGYAASWENEYSNEKSQPFSPCEPTTFGGYPKEKTIYNNVTNRAFNVLVETSYKKEPLPADMGNFQELYNANVDFYRTKGTSTKVVGHVPRNVRLALMMIEMAQPLVRWVDAGRSSALQTVDTFPAASLYTTSDEQVTKMGCGARAWERKQVATCSATDCSVISAAHSKLQIAWEVLGALTVDSTHVQVSSSASFEDDTVLIETTAQKGTTRRFYEFASNSSKAAAANAADKMETSLFVTCLDLGNVTSDKFYVRAVATVDQNWKKQGTGANMPSPQVPPQSHLVNARTNAGWNAKWNGHKVKAGLEWASPILTVDAGKKSKTKAAEPEASSDGSPEQESSFTFQSTSSQRDSADSDDNADSPVVGKVHASKV